LHLQILRLRCLPMKEWLAYAVAWSVLKAVGWLPRSLARGAGAMVARALMTLTPKLRKTTEFNMRVAPVWKSQPQIKFGGLAQFRRQRQQSLRNHRSRPVRQRTRQPSHHFEHTPRDCVRQPFLHRWTFYIELRKPACRGQVQA